MFLVFLMDVTRPSGNAWPMPSSRLLIGRRSMRFAYYTLTTTVAGRRHIFTDPASVKCVVDALRQSDQELRTQTLAWVVMPDHVHWLVQLRNDNLSRCMQRFKSRSARAFNLLHDTCGASVWQRGYYDHCIRGDHALQAHAQYLMENPVRAGLVTTPEAYPHQWNRWLHQANGSADKNGTPKGAVDS